MYLIFSFEKVEDIKILYEGPYHVVYDVVYSQRESSNSVPEHIIESQELPKLVHVSGPFCESPPRAKIQKLDHTGQWRTYYLAHLIIKSMITGNLILLE